MKKSIFLLALTFLFIGQYSCKRGCTDPRSFNYDETAERDNGKCLTRNYDGFSTYDFSNVDYADQTSRLDMLDELVDYMSSANTVGVTLSINTLLDYFANSNSPYTDASLNTSGVQLKDQCFSTDIFLIEGYMVELKDASQNPNIGGQGIAGVVTSTTNPAKSYLFDDKGVEYAQYIQKGIMSAVFYHQISEVFTREAAIGDGVDNTMITDGQGTDMEHNWDQAFGYFGVPTDFLTNADAGRYWGKYCNGRNDLLGTNDEVMKAFTKGRVAISSMDYASRDSAAVEVRQGLERVMAASAIHYLNGALADIADDALRNHQLSEAYAFAFGIKYNTDNIISQADHAEVLEGFGSNYYTITTSQIMDVRDLLASVYGMESIKTSL